MAHLTAAHTSPLVFAAELALLALLRRADLLEQQLRKGLPVGRKIFVLMAPSKNATLPAVRRAAATL
jgi:hypothetical protein